jgi:cobalt-zinc-cadmium efflux system outer membrane protein
MKARCVVVLCTALAGGLREDASAEGLTLEEAMARARERSVEVLAARRRLAEAEARMLARPSLRDNPALEGAYGARDGAPADFELALSQTFELGGRGGARRDADRAALERERAEAARVVRGVLREVRVAFLRGLHAAERVSLAASVEADAVELDRIARRRHEAGDIAALDVNVASSALARARAELKAAEAGRVAADRDLRVLLDTPPGTTLVLSGDLRQERSYDAAALLSDVAERPELRSLAAQVGEAEAEVRLGKGLEWPEVTPAVRYERDEGKRVLWAGLTVSLPLFDRGQQLRAVGRARAEGIRVEAEARSRAAANEVHGALALHELRLAAVRELAANAQTLADSEALARRSYEVGQIGLGELLLLRRETADARREWLDSLLGLAEVRAELDSLSGDAR